MAYTNVASCVISIVGSFSNGIDVFKRLRDKRRRRKRSKKLDRADEEELRLSRSLRQGPEDIGREYQRSVYEAGQYFEIGDAVAQTSLAEIILRLNTGLVSIITSFLNNDKKGVQLDYQSLTDLSERSRIDTCRALRQLLKRMTQVRRPLAIKGNERASSEARRPVNDNGGHGRKKRHPAPIKPTKVRGPMLAQIVIEDSSKPAQIAMVRPGERRKKSSSGSSLSKTHSESSTAVSSPLPTPPPEYTAVDNQRPAMQRTQTAPEVPKPRRKHSTAVLQTHDPTQASGMLRATKSTPRLVATLPAMPEPAPPPLPNRAAVSSSNLVTRRRKPTPTYYSIASDQTKLGEIPLHKWAEPYDFDQMSMLNREAYNNGWPLNQLGTQEPKRKRFGLGRLFGKKAAA